MTEFSGEDALPRGRIYRRAGTRTGLYCDDRQPCGKPGRTIQKLAFFVESKTEFDRRIAGYERLSRQCEREREEEVRP